MKRGKRLSSYVLIVICVLASLAIIGLTSSGFAASTATITGRVTDGNDAVIPGAKVTGTNIDTNIDYPTETNREGIYVLTNLPPGRYRVSVSKEGFHPIVWPDIQLHVQDVISVSFTMKLGSLAQSITVEGGAPLIQSESASVRTLVDRQFVGNLPLNGRSFQSLIAITPGVVTTKTNGSEQGQFSVNGQRANANYFMVDGVSANISTSAGINLSQVAGGSLPGLSASGGTNNLVSVEALQEFKVQTSTYAPEFGRTPGAQISIATRSGTNNFRGSFFEYFRNDVLDANDWFNNSRGNKRPALRQNIFGGVLGGPIVLPRFGLGGSPALYKGRDRTFFFFSYEGQRVRQPQAGITDVPSLAARQSAPAAIRPFLNAFPVPTGSPRANGSAEFAASFSNPLTLDASSIRIDHTVNKKFTVFGRHNYAPSETVQRGPSRSLNTLNPATFNTQTTTLGATLIITPSINNDFRANYSRNRGSSTFHLDTFGGAVVPPESTLFPAFASSRESQFSFSLNNTGTNVSFLVGKSAESLQRQSNLVDNLSISAGAHQLKLGIDYRRLSPVYSPRNYSQLVAFNGVSGALAGITQTATVNSDLISRVPLFMNFSAYAQDTWRVTPRLALTYGLRWEYNPPPSEADGNEAYTVTGLDNPATLELAPRGTPLWKATRNNFAPRIGAAYQLSSRKGTETVLRGGFGIFYDLGNSQAAQAFIGFPFTASMSLGMVRFPLDSALAAPPSLNPAAQINNMYIFEPNLKLPYTYQWNVAIEQSLGVNQTISASYVAAVGRRLLRQETLSSAAGLNAKFSSVFVTRSVATSDYHALQLQFQRRLSQGLQTLASYTWSHSIDSASNDSFANNFPASAINPQLDRGASDFDVRHAFNSAITYNFPAPPLDVISRSVLRDWSADAIFSARSATPINVSITRLIGISSYLFRPDLVQGIPLYLDDPIAPGGRRLNNTSVPGNPRQLGPFFAPAEIRQGTLERNALRAFPIWQLDFALRRQFNFTERFNLQFKAEFFNLFNHPNFGNPVGALGTVSTTGVFSPRQGFGLPISMFGRDLGSGGLNGGFNPLYQVGGPRSLQFSLKLQF